MRCTEDGILALRRAINRLKSERERDWEQCFNMFTRDEWDRFYMRHAELHLSYIVPVIAFLTPIFFGTWLGTLAHRPMEGFSFGWFATPITAVVAAVL